MILSHDAKELSTTLRHHSFELFEWAYSVIEKSIVGCSLELEFLNHLASQITATSPAMDGRQAHFWCRSKTIHGKPIVRMHPKGRCELGDLLIVVKYHLLDGTVEAKSIIYQVKLPNRSGRKFQINQYQLRLLRDWPQFYFGLRRDGGPRRYRVRPRTTEFGSYMLEPRGAARRPTIEWKIESPPQFGDTTLILRPIYGSCPTAWQVNQDGPGTISSARQSQYLTDASALIAQIAFCIGEHHSNVDVADLVAALYRYVGLDPDPPEEFEGYRAPEGTRDGFSVLEINVKQGSAEGAH